MTFRLHVDAERWRTHLRAQIDAVVQAGAQPVPVIKGNGYGFGREVLLSEAARLGVSAVAVGTVFEAEAALASGRFSGDIVVLAPWEPRDGHAAEAWDRVNALDAQHRIVRTVSDAAAVAAAQASGRRHVVEQISSMHRFGVNSVTAFAHAAGCEGLSVHLPITAPPPPARAPLAHGVSTHALEAIAALPDASSSLWVSHLSGDDVRQVVAHAQGAQVRVRVGTSLWLGDRGAFSALGTVLAVHRDVSAPVGYRQRRGPSHSTLLVVGGGTAHGVALAAPSAASSVRSRAVSVASGVLEASGRMRSPFHIGGADGPQAWFAEAPHMHVSLLWLPRGWKAPEVGEELHCDIRMTIAHPDLITGL